MKTKYLVTFELKEEVDFERVLAQVKRVLGVNDDYNYFKSFNSKTK